MKMHRTQGIVLRRFKSGEADRVLVILTEDLGKVRAVARGTRRSRSKLAGHLEPLAGARLSFVEGRGELWMVTAAELTHPRSYSMAQLSAGWQAAELADRLSADHEPAPRLFEALESFLAELATHPDPLYPLLRFTFLLLRSSGWEPVSDRCAHCGRSLTGTPLFVPGQGGVVHSSCASEEGIEVRPETVETLRDLPLSASPEAIAELRKLEAAYLPMVLSRELRSAQVNSRLEKTVLEGG